jgi:hypothetical protein
MSGHVKTPQILYKNVDPRHVANRSNQQRVPSVDPNPSVPAPRTGLGPGGAGPSGSPPSPGGPVLMVRSLASEATWLLGTCDAGRASRRLLGRRRWVIRAAPVQDD